MTKNDYYDFVELTVLKGSNLCGKTIKDIKKILNKYKSLSDKVELFAIYSSNVIHGKKIKEDHKLEEGSTIVLKVNPEVYKNKEWEKFISEIV